jgi:predicted nucleic acid-binding protein
MTRAALKIALDTNVLLAVLLRLQLDGKANVMISSPVMAEFQKHLKGKFKANAAQIQTAVTALDPFEKHSGSTTLDLQTVPDPDDIAVLHAALSWQASHFVTGDKALWTISPLHGLPIIAPREAFTLLHAAI